MEQILEQFGEEFTITGKRLGWYIGHFPMCDVWMKLTRIIFI